MVFCVRAASDDLIGAQHRHGSRHRPMDWLIPESHLAGRLHSDSVNGKDRNVPGLKPRSIDE